MIKRIFSSELGKGTVILLITMNIFNLFNFFFQFIMGRLLGPEEYGTLAVLITIIGIYTLPGEAIQKLSSNYASKFNIKGEKGKIKDYMIKALKKSSKWSLGLFLIILLISFGLTDFLKINLFLLMGCGIFVFFSFFIPIEQGILQGRKKFGLMGFSLMIEALFKLIFAVSFVLLGFQVFGAIFGMFFGSLSGLIFLIYFNEDILSSKREETAFKGIYFESQRYFLIVLIITLMYSVDILFIKRYFAPEVVGQYAAISVISKILFLGTIAVSNVMFPLTNEKYHENKESKKLFFRSLSLTSLLCGGGLIFYSLFSHQLISVLYGREYLSLSIYLPLLGLSFAFLSLSNLTLIYRLSKNDLGKEYLLILVLILEIVFFHLFHRTILEYILVILFSNIIMFISSFLLTKKVK
jgi:O-antigen/teichoic acid export membrane protein